MQEKEFNLLEEPWIKVLSSDLSVKEISLIDCLIHAHEYKALAGEMPTQDFAVLRLLLACMQSIFYQYDADGERDTLSREENDSEDALNRWEAYKGEEHFSEEAIRSYFSPYTEYFWLFHPTRPFYQCANLTYGTDYGAKCLLGNIKTSNNDTNNKYHFSMCEGEKLSQISYSEAARWLLHLNGFSVNVKNDKTAPGTKKPAGVGRLGRLGIIYIDADNLFDLIMMNLTPLDKEGDLWNSPNPIWEHLEMMDRTHQQVEILQSNEIPYPDNLPERYTVQSRRILLRRKDGYVIGYRAMNGDFFSYEDDFNEPMTLWKGKVDKKTNKTTFLPKQHSPEVQAWQEFPEAFQLEENVEKGQIHTPGIVQWAETVCEKFPEETKNKIITFKTAGMLYDGMSYKYVECISDGLSLSYDLLNLLNSNNRALIKRIIQQIDKCKQVKEKAIRPFTKRIGTVLNQPDLSSNLTNQLSDKFYSEINQPFRDWLVKIKPNEEMQTYFTEWEKTARKVAENIAEDYMGTLGEDAYSFCEEGRKIVSIPGAYNIYLNTLWTIYKKEDHELSREEVL